MLFSSDYFYKKKRFLKKWKLLYSSKSSTNLLNFFDKEKEKDFKYFSFSKRLNFKKFLKMKNKNIKKINDKRRRSKYFIFYQNKTTFAKLISKYFFKNILKSKFFHDVPPKKFFKG